MSMCRLIVCEKTSRWATALRSALASELAGQPPPIAETRSLSQAEAALCASPASLVAFEITAANLAAALDFLDRARRQFSSAQFVALLPADKTAAAPLLREAGAIDVATSVFEANRVARLTRRHFALAPTAPQQTISALLTQRLPWSAYASP